MSLEILQQEILALSKTEQLDLMLFLTNALSKKEDNFLTNEQLSEISRRLLQYKSGELQAIEEKDVMDRLYAKYKPQI